MSAKYIVGVECVMMIMLLVGSLALARLASSRHQEQYTTTHGNRLPFVA